MFFLGKIMLEFDNVFLVGTDITTDGQRIIVPNILIEIFLLHVYHGVLGTRLEGAGEGEWLAAAADAREQSEADNGVDGWLEVPAREHA
jgi:hypothetical protein